MGAWGPGIKENDMFQDIWLEFEKGYHQGSSPKELRIKFEEELLPDHEFHSEIWTAIGYGQWMCGEVEKYTIEQLKLCIAGHIGLKLWAEDQDLLSKRLKVLSQFIETISIPKVKPLKRKKIVLCPTYFEKGDVISIEIDNGRYTSGLVIGKTDFDFDGENSVMFSNLISTKHLTSEEHMKSKVMYFDIGGVNEYHKGFFWATYSSRNMKRRIKKTKIVGHIELENHLSLAVGIQIGDWNNIPSLYSQQLEYHTAYKTKEPFVVPFSKVPNGNDSKLQQKLYEFDKKMTREKLNKIRNTS